jgi:predicted dehydrogenase
MNPRIIKTGIIGFGQSGRVFHYPVIAGVHGLSLVKVMERKPENRHHVPAGIAIADSPEGVIDDPEIELAVICAPNAAHFELARRCLEAGKHVVVEKPFTVFSAEGRELAALAAAKGLLLSVYHNRRFDADFLTIRRLLAEGRLGRLVRYEARFDRFRKAIKPGWRETEVPGAGVLYDLGSHLIDQALCLFGAPARVGCHLRTERDGAVVPDAFDLFLEYREGPFVSLHATMLAREIGPRYVVTGIEGSFVKRGLDIQEEQLKAGRLPADHEDWGQEPEDIWGRFLSEKAGIPHSEHVPSETGDYRLYYEDIVRAIVNRCPPQVTAEDAVAVVRVIELAMEAARTGSFQPWS